MKAICPDDERLACWIEGALADADRTAVAEHLASCDPCRRGLALAWIALNESAAAGLSSEQERAARAALAGGSGCPEEIRIARWLEGALPAEDRPSLVEHLGACDRCRRAAALAKVSIDTDPARALDSGVRRAVAVMVRERTACPDDEKLASFLDGQLDGSDRAVVLEHCASCDDCRRTAALARLTKVEPVHALTLAQERAARRILIGRTAPRWWLMVAAAAVFIAVAGILFLVLHQDTQPPMAREPDNAPKAMVVPAAKTPVDQPKPPAPRTTATPKEEPKTPEPPKEELKPEPPKEEPKTSEPEPRKEEPKPEPLLPKRTPGRTRTAVATKPATIFDVQGTITLDGRKPETDGSAKADVDDVFTTENGATVNVNGRALVSLDRKAEVAIGTVASDGALLVAMHQGRAFVDTVKNELACELWYGQQQCQIPNARGRMMIDVTTGTLKVTVLAGEIAVRHGSSAKPVLAGQTAMFAGEGMMQASADRELVRDAMARANELRPKSMILYRADFGADQSLAAGRLSEAGKLRFACGTSVRGPNLPQLTEPQVWVGLELSQAVSYTSRTELVIRCRTSAAKLNVVVGDHHKEVAVKPTGTSWGEFAIPLKGAEKDGVQIIDEEFRSVWVGAKSGSQLEIDTLHVRRGIE